MPISAASGRLTPATHHAVAATVARRPPPSLFSSSLLLSRAGALPVLIILKAACAYCSCCLLFLWFPLLLLLLVRPPAIAIPPWGPVNIVIRILLQSCKLIVASSLLHLLTDSRQRYETAAWASLSTASSICVFTNIIVIVIFIAIIKTNKNKNLFMLFHIQRDPSHPLAWLVKVSAEVSASEDDRWLDGVVSPLPSFASS